MELAGNTQERTGRSKGRSSSEKTARKYSNSCGDFQALRRCVEVCWTDAKGLRHSEHLARAGVAKKLRSIVNLGAETLTLRRCWISDYCWRRYLTDREKQKTGETWKQQDKNRVLSARS